MALRNQPYIPLYVQDYLTDEKLNECSASTQGIYMKIMCLMHKSEKYGKILLKQKYKQKLSKTSSKVEGFAWQLLKHLSFSKEEIYNALKELTDENVLYIENDYLCQRRMIRDNEISIKRAKAGRKGGICSKFATAKSEANSEYENAIENEGRNINIKKEFKPPDLQEVKKYFKDNGYSEQIAEKAFHYYNEADWHDKNGDKVKNWKQKMQGNWFKEEGKQQPQIKDPTRRKL